MFPQMDSFQKFGKDQMEASTKVMAACSEAMRAMASEWTDYCKRASETSSEAMAKLSQARTPDALVDLNTKVMKQSCEDGVACATRMLELWGNVAREAYKPYEGAFSAATNFAQSMTPKSR